MTRKDNKTLPMFPETLEQKTEKEHRSRARRDDGVFEFITEGATYFHAPNTKYNAEKRRELLAGHFYRFSEKGRQSISKHDNEEVSRIYDRVYGFYFKQAVQGLITAADKTARKYK